MANPRKKVKRNLTDVEGFINFVSSPRKSKTDREFFEVDINCKTKSIRGICYDVDRSPLLQKFNKDQQSCLIMNAESSNNDIIINDETIVKLKEVDFENLTHESPTYTMEQVINECPLYQRITVIGQLFNLQEPTLSSIKKTRLREGSFIDKSNSTRPITFFQDDHINMVKERTSYKITNVVVSKYSSKKILQVSENSIITEITDSGDYNLPEQSGNCNASGIISMIELDSLQKQFFCKLCSHPIKPTSRNLFKCCGKIFTDIDVIAKTDVVFTLRYDDTTSRKFSCSRPLLDGLVGKNGNADEDIFISLLLKKAVTIEHCSKQKDDCFEVMKIKNRQDEASSSLLENEAIPSWQEDEANT